MYRGSPMCIVTKQLRQKEKTSQECSPFIRQDRIPLFAVVSPLKIQITLPGGEDS